MLPLRRKTTLANINSLPPSPTPSRLVSFVPLPRVRHDTKRSGKRSAKSVYNLYLSPLLSLSPTSEQTERNAKRNFEEKAATSSPVHMHGSKVKITGADFPSAGKSCRIGGKETVPIPVKIRSNNRRNRCGKRHGRNRTNTKPSPPPLGSPAEKSERTDGEKKRRGARGAGVRGENAALCSRLPGTTCTYNRS